MLAESEVSSSDERMVPDAGDAVQCIAPARLDTAVRGITLRRLVGGKIPVRRIEQGLRCLEGLACFSG